MFAHNPIPVRPPRGANAPPSREACAALDRADVLAAWRERFTLADDIVYLDGNSLGALPKATAARVAKAIQNEWGEGLIRSWNRSAETSGWIDAPQRVGDAIAPLIGAAPGEVVVADSTSVNLFKVLTVALKIAASEKRRRIVSEAENFPTDLYIAEGLSALLGGATELHLIECDANGANGDETLNKIDRAIGEALDETCAVLMLTHVNYRTGAMHDMARVTQRAHDAGALVVWDLAHSAGAVPVDLHAAGADFAIGCGYKYLNGGPGAPAFLWAHARHRDRFEQPLSGWMGHADPFAFTSHYAPAKGIARFLCGTPPILSMAALECGVASIADAGMAALRAKSIALTECFIAAVEARMQGVLELASPRDTARRGSQVCFRPAGELAGHTYALMQALIARGVIGDFRAPDILRFGFAPAYVRFVDSFDAAQALADVIAKKEYLEVRFQVKAAVT